MTSLPSPQSLFLLRVFNVHAGVSIAYMFKIYKIYGLQIRENMLFAFLSLTYFV